MKLSTSLAQLGYQQVVLKPIDVPRILGHVLVGNAARAEGDCVVTCEDGPRGPVFRLYFPHTSCLARWADDVEKCRRYLEVRRQARG